MDTAVAPPAGRRAPVARRRRVVELRHQVWWLQTVTVVVLVAVVVVGTVTQTRIAVASAGLPQPDVGQVLREQARPLAGVLFSVLGVCIAGNALVSWRVRRATRGLGTQTLAWMLDFYEGVLHVAREGMVLVDPWGTVQLVNDEALRLLGLTTVRPGTPLADIRLPADLLALLGGETPLADRLHPGPTGLLLLNSRVSQSGRLVTLRDHTQLQELVGELGAVRSLVSSLEAQHHESANRLHTVVSLIEIGEPQRAKEFAVSELQFTQALTDQIVGTVDDPVLASLLLAKLAQAQERGVRLTIELDDSGLATALPPQDTVTVVGNLLDNAIEAARSEGQQVEVHAAAHGTQVVVRVTNTATPMDDEAAALLTEPGWTTKPDPGHGLGLALVQATVARWRGELVVDPDAELAGRPAVSVSVSLPRKGSRHG